MTAIRPDWALNVPDSDDHGSTWYLANKDSKAEVQADLDQAIEAHNRLKQAERKAGPVFERLGEQMRQHGIPSLMDGIQRVNQTKQEVDALDAQIAALKAPALDLAAQAKSVMTPINWGHTDDRHLRSSGIPINYANGLFGSLGNQLYTANETALQGTIAARVWNETRLLPGDADRLIDNLMRAARLLRAAHTHLAAVDGKVRAVEGTREALVARANAWGYEQLRAQVIDAAAPYHEAKAAKAAWINELREDLSYLSQAINDEIRAAMRAKGIEDWIDPTPER